MFRESVTGLLWDDTSCDAEGQSQERGGLVPDWYPLSKRSTVWQNLVVLAWATHTTSRRSRLHETDAVCLGQQKRCHQSEHLPPLVSGPNPPSDIDQYHSIEVSITDSSWLNWLQSTQSMNRLLSRWKQVFDLPKQSLHPETQRSILESKQTW